MNALVESRWLPIVLLCASNIFMTFAWYGHLKFKAAPLWLVILASWGIAFFEYTLMVPANRWGNFSYSATELKIIQEVITLLRSLLMIASKEDSTIAASRASASGSDGSSTLSGPVTVSVKAGLPMSRLLGRASMFLLDE